MTSIFPQRYLGRRTQDAGRRTQDAGPTADNPRTLTLTAFPLGQLLRLATIAASVRFLTALITAWRQRPWTLALALAFGIAACLAAPFDAVISQLLIIGETTNRDRHLEGVIEVVKILGNGEVAFAVLLLCAALGHKRRAWELLVALLFMSIVVHGLKHGVGRMRPNGKWGSFPSGDAATAAVLVAVLVPMFARQGLRSVLSVIVGGTWMLLVAYGRIAEIRHFPSDVCAGMGFGVLAAASARCWSVPRWWMRLHARWWAIGGGAMIGIYAIIVALDRNDATGRELHRFLALAGAPVVAWILARHLRAWHWRREGRPLPTPALLAIVASGMLAVYLAIASATTLWDRDEPRNAQASAEMQASGTWLVPTYNGEWRLHKPILVNWAMRASYAIFGVNDLSARLPAVIAALIAVLALGHSVQRLLGSRGPSLAMAMLGCAPLLAVTGTAATTDALLLMGLGIAMAAFSEALATTREDGTCAPRWIPTVGFGFGIGIALLAKGPVALVPPLGALLLVMFAVPACRPHRWRWLGHGSAALVLATGMILAWFIPANAQTDGAYVAEALGKHVVGRSVTAMESHGGSRWLWLPYYPLVLILVMVPWSALLPSVLVHWWQTRRAGDAAWAVATGWAALFIVVITLVATKLPHYCLPIIPALAMLAARWWQAGGLTTTRRLAWGRGLIAPVIAACLLVPSAVVIPWYQLRPNTAVFEALMMPGFAIAIAAATLWLALPRNPRHLGRDGIRLACVSAGFLVAVGAIALQGATPFKPQPIIAAAIRAATPASEPITLAKTKGFEEGTLLFAVERGPITVLANSAGNLLRDQLIAWAAIREPGVLVVDQTTWIDAGGSSLGADTIGATEWIGPRLDQRTMLIVRRRTN